MLLYDKGYSYLKQEYIVPLSKYKVNYRSIGTTNIKSILKGCQFTSVQYVGPSHFKFVFDEETILTALLGDLWLCYIRAVLQKDSAKKIYPLYPDFCPNWSIVSDYYFAFYCASTLLRLTMRGTIYLDSSVSKPLNYTITSVLNGLNAVKENSTYNIYKDTDQEGKYILDLKPSGRQTHETVWIETAQVIKMLSSKSDHTSDEYTFLKCLTLVLGRLEETFPCKLRNQVNYQLPYGMKAVDKKIFPAYACEYNPNGKWLEAILSYTGKADDNVDQRLQLFSAYIKYLDILVNNLITEYYDIQGRQCGIQHAINRKRSTPIIFPEATYTYR